MTAATKALKPFMNDEEIQAAKRVVDQMKEHVEATIVAGDHTFRIVKQVQGQRVTYLLELPDGFDALGVERWKDVSADGKVVRVMRDYIIRSVTKE